MQKFFTSFFDTSTQWNYYNYNCLIQYVQKFCIVVLQCLKEVSPISGQYSHLVPLKTLENQRFSRGYNLGTLTKNFVIPQRIVIPKNFVIPVCKRPYGFLMF